MGIEFVQAQEFTLAGSGVGATDTSITLKTFNQIDGTPLVMSNFGDMGFCTMEPGTSREEQITFTGVTQNADGTATLTGVTRGVQFVSPYAQDLNLRKGHAGGTILRVSNTAAFYNQLSNLSGDETITGTWTFTNPNYPRMDVDTPFPVDSEQLTTKAYVDSVAVAGAPDATETVKGIIEIATTAEIDAGTATGGTGASVVARPDNLATSIYGVQLPSADEKDALAGTSGTPDTSNRYVTDDDTAVTSTADKVVRGNGSGIIDSSWLEPIYTGTTDSGDAGESITSPAVVRKALATTSSSLGSQYAGRNGGGSGFDNLLDSDTRWYSFGLNEAVGTEVTQVRGMTLGIGGVFNAAGQATVELWSGDYSNPNDGGNVMLATVDVNITGLGSFDFIFASPVDVDLINTEYYFILKRVAGGTLDTEFDEPLRQVQSGSIIGGGTILGWVTSNNSGVSWTFTSGSGSSELGSYTVLTNKEVAGRVYNGTPLSSDGVVSTGTYTPGDLVTYATAGEVDFTGAVAGKTYYPLAGGDITSTPSQASLSVGTSLISDKLVLESGIEYGVTALPTMSVGNGWNNTGGTLTQIGGYVSFTDPTGASVLSVLRGLGDDTSLDFSTFPTVILETEAKVDFNFSGANRLALGLTKETDGLDSPQGSGDTTVRFLWDATGFYSVTSNATGETATLLTTPTDGWHSYKIFLNGGAKFYIDGELVSTHTTNVPEDGTIHCGVGADDSETIFTTNFKVSVSN